MTHCPQAFSYVNVPNDCSPLITTDETVTALPTAMGTFEPIDIFVDDVNDADEDADPAPGDAQFKLTVVLIEAGG